MSSVKIHVIGRLGADAEMRKTRSGKDFLTFNLAVDDFVSGEKTTSWFTVADFSETANRKAEFLKKGSLIEVQGIETCRLFTDKSNTTRIARDIRATYIDFVSSSKNDKSETTDSVDCGAFSPNKETQHTTPTPQPIVSATSSSSSNTDLIDDLPF